MERHIFLDGRKYQPLIDFDCGASSFHANEILTFSKDGYSRYDECFVYEFRDDSGQIKTWLMPEDAENDYWRKYFSTFAEHESKNS